MFQRILAPVDFTDRSARAVETAGEMADLYLASVTLLHVIELVDGLSFEEMRDLYEKLEQKARKSLAALAERLSGAEVSVNEVVIYGKRARAILDYAAENKMDLILMSSHQVTPSSGFSTISYHVAM